MRSYTTFDKTKWGDGPWQDEPDKAQWIDDETGLDCLIVRNHFGALCGYVGVSADHSLYGKSYDDVPDLYVHGGLTFAGSCREGPEESSICHVPEDGRPDDVWWFGFDCAHGFDLVPVFRDIGPFEEEVYRNLGYVQEQCRELARQLQEVSS